VKLSTSIEDAITSGDDCRGRDSQLTGWAEEARRLEEELAEFTATNQILAHDLDVAITEMRKAWIDRDRYRAALDSAKAMYTIARSALESAPLGEKRG
jgi:hypothetical protein